MNPGQTYDGVITGWDLDRDGPLYVGLVVPSGRRRSLEKVASDGTFHVTFPNARTPPKLLVWAERSRRTLLRRPITEVDQLQVKLDPVDPIYKWRYRDPTPDVPHLPRRYIVSSRETVALGEPRVDTRLPSSEAQEPLQHWSGKGWTQEFRRVVARGEGTLEFRRPPDLVDRGQAGLERPETSRSWHADQGFWATLSARGSATWIPVLKAYLRDVPGANELPDGDPARWKLENQHVDRIPPACGDDCAQIQDAALAHWSTRGYVEAVSGGADRWFRARRAWWATSWERPDRFAIWDEGDEHLVDRLLNGICPAFLRHDPKKPGVYHAEIHWHRYEQDGPYYGGNLPSVRFVLTEGDEPPKGIRRVDTGALRNVPPARSMRWPNLTRIDLHWPQPDERRASYTPVDPDWAHVKRIARMALLVAGETDFHMARCHLLTEYHLVAARAALVFEREPCKLLWPYLRSADEINRFGDPLIFEHTGILARATALSATAVKQRLRDHLGTMCWKGYSPRKPLNPWNRYAYAAQIFWQATREFVTDWFRKSPPDDADWSQIEQMSALLARHAVDGHRLEPLDPGDGTRWLDTGELPLEPIFAKDARRAGSFGAGLTISRGNLDDLIQFCTYAIFHATFVHSWTGGAQFDDGGNVLYAPLGIQSRSMPKDEADYVANIGPKATHAGMQLAMAELLTKVRWGMLLRDDEYDNDVHTEFRVAIAKRWSDWAAIGVSPLGFRARVNI